MKSFGELGLIDRYAVFAFVGCIVMIVGALGYVGMIPGGGPMVWLFAFGLLITVVPCILFYIARRALFRDAEE